jgi:hypothetical protein
MLYLYLVPPVCTSTFYRQCVPLLCTTSLFHNFVYHFVPLVCTYNLYRHVVPLLSNAGLYFFLPTVLTGHYVVPPGVPILYTASVYLYLYRQFVFILCTNSSYHRRVPPVCISTLYRRFVALLCTARLYR